MSKSNNHTRTLFAPESPQEEANIGAQFSEDGKHRLKLWRIWDDRLPLVMFIGLNPSKANGNVNDNTITRVISFATKWGYGGVYMMNLFTYVSTNPDYLVQDDNWEGNKTSLAEVASKCERIIFAWGGFKQARDRARLVIPMFPNAYCITKNRDGSPGHPLYLSSNAFPFPFKGIYTEGDGELVKMGQDFAKDFLNTTL